MHMLKYLESPLVKYALGLIELIFAIAFVLKTLDAGTAAPFVKAVYGASEAFAAPFDGMFRDKHLRGGGMLDMAILSGMAIYAVLVFAPVALHKKYKKERTVVV